ncbi:MAG: alpha/beta hydrolase [Burkholderiales bacterium]|jgi:pimeloyl-ACP methyl ester carboxylesterase|nr:alpha/beta hydrolase [Burkholderiales bacterium]
MTRRRFLAATGAALGLAALSGCAGTSVLGGEPRRAGTPIDVNGARLNVDIAGDGEPVVLLHGFTFDLRMWDAQVEPLAARHRIVRYDLRGYGLSSLPQPGMLYSHADDLAALAARTGASRPHLVGFGLGARVALDYALAYPDRVQSIVLVEGVVGGWTWSPAFQNAYRPVLEAGRRGDVAAAKAAWLQQPFFATARARPDVMTRVQRMVGDYSGWHFTHVDPERPLTPPAVRRFEELRVPTLALVGERGVPDVHRMAEALVAGAPNARRATLAAAGYASPLETPESVNAALLAFLSAPH